MRYINDEYDYLLADSLCVKETFDTILNVYGSVDDIADLVQSYKNLYKHYNNLLTAHSVDEYPRAFRLGRYSI